MTVDTKTKEVIQEWSLTSVRRWAASPNSFTLDLGDFSEVYYSVQTQVCLNHRDQYLLSRSSTRLLAGVEQWFNLSCKVRWLHLKVEPSGWEDDLQMITPFLVGRREDITVDITAHRSDHKEEDKWRQKVTWQWWWGRSHWAPSYAWYRMLTFFRVPRKLHMYHVHYKTFLNRAQNPVETSIWYSHDTNNWVVKYSTIED